MEFSPDRLGPECRDVSVAEHDEILKVRWNVTVKPNDIVYVLGDVAMSVEALKDFKFWNGRKILIRGNHDTQSEGLYRDIFYKILGTAKLNRVWFSHAPIHPDELRGYPNIHGHVHDNIIKHNHRPDKRYRAVCVEQNHGWPEPYDQVMRELK